MESLLTPEALGGAGVGVGGIALVFFIRFVFQLGGFKVSVDELVAELKKTLRRQRDHLDREEKHHKRIEDLLEKIESHARPGVPRPMGVEHTPIRGIEATSPP